MNAPLSPLAQRLVDLRQGRLRREDLEATLAPPDASVAMAVQAEVTHALRERVGGWKVGIGPDGVPFAAPLYASGLRPSPAALPIADYLLIEMEIGVRLAKDLTPGTYAREAVLDAVDQVLVGIEVLRGRIGEPPAVPFPVFLADNGANVAYVTGEGSDAFRALDLRALPCRLVVGGRAVHEKVGGHPQGDPIEPIRAWLAQANDRLGGLRAGHVVTTGSLNTPVRVDVDAQIEATIDGLGTAALRLSPSGQGEAR